MIEDARIVQCFISSFVSYQILVKTETEIYYVQKRYKEFNSLKDLLSLNYKGKIPSFPEKVWIGNTKQKVIQERYLLLNNFMKFLLKKQIQRLRVVQEFFKKC